MARAWIDMDRNERKNYADAYAFRAFFAGLSEAERAAFFAAGQIGGAAIVPLKDGKKAIVRHYSDGYAVHTFED